MLDLLDAGLPSPAGGAFSGRAGGVSDRPWDGLNLGLHVEDEWRRVHANRDLLRAALDLTELAFAQQVHGAGVAVVEQPSSRARQGGVRAVDALVSTTPGLGLVVLAADCLPVVLADPVAGVVAAAHAGRQGLIGGVLQETVRVMVERGAEVSRVVARIGPAACGACYEVPQQMADEVEALVPGSRATTRTGTPSVDLVAGARGVLAGVGVVQVGEVGGCTLEQPDRFYSYRRDGQTGRHAGVAWLRA